MGDSMSTIINATTTNGVVIEPDNSGSLVLQTNSGTTALTIDTSQRAAFVAGTAAAPAITTTGDTDTGLFFPAADTIAFAEGGAEAMRLNSSGNVGIGTTSPAEKLNVVGSSTNAVGMRVDNTQSSTVGTLYNTSTTYSYSGIGASTTWFYGNKTVAVGTDSANPVQFICNNAERMRIDSSGNLFIGTTTNPVSNAVAIINAVVSSGDGFNLKHTVNGNNMFNLWQTGSTTYTAISFSKGDSQTVRGNITVSTSSVAYNTTSDYRLKENVLPMIGALEKVSKLKPVTYKWKENDSDGQGFIAHELQEVIPDAVTGEKDAVDAEGKPVYQGVDTSFLVATLTAAIQEQQTIINDLKARVAVLEAK
jgi:hypothetical protein